MRSFVLLLVAGLGVGAAAPASAQWIRVGALPARDVFSVRSLKDTIVASVDTAVFVSTDAGATWRQSSKPATGVIINAVLMLNHRLYAGTFGQGAFPSNKGVFVSDDLGTTWQAFNQGLVGGILDSQLDIDDFEVQGDNLVLATAGAGVWVRRISIPDTWHLFGDVFEPNQAANVNDLALGNDRLFACAGNNGQAFDRDPGALDWTVSTFANGPLVPGMTAESAFWTGDRWVVGTNSGVLLSPTGQDAWTVSSTAFTGMKWSTFAQVGRALFIGSNALNNFSLSSSSDDGNIWSPIETTLNTFGYRLALQGTQLYAARSDGLWFRSVAGTVSVGDDGGRGLAFALASGQPVHESARFRFELPRADAVSIEFFDVAGRCAAHRIAGLWDAGAHDVSLDTRAMAPGVYLARLTAAGASRTARFACVH